MRRILDDTHVYKEAKDFINLFEDYATAYKANAIDRDLAYKLSASRVIRYYKVFKPLIDGLRQQLNNQMYWREFERLVTKDWQPHRIEEIEDFERKKDKDQPEYR